MVSPRIEHRCQDLLRLAYTDEAAALRELVLLKKQAIKYSRRTDRMYIDRIIHNIMELNRGADIH